MLKFADLLEIYESKLEKLLNEIKTAKTLEERNLAESRFDDILFELSTYNDKRAKYLVKKYDSKREDYKLEQEIKKREVD